MKDSDSTATLDMRHDIETAISAIEMAFYELLRNPQHAIESRDLFVKSVTRLRHLKTAIKMEGSPIEKASGV
jgi:hypothetical protein